MKNHDLVTPKPCSTLDAHKFNIEDHFTEKELHMQHRARLPEDDEKYVEKEYEVYMSSQWSCGV